MKFTLLCLSVLLCGFVSVAIVRGETLIGNLDQFTSSAGPYSTISSTGVGKAVGFTVGATSWKLEEVALILGFPHDGADPAVEIWTADDTGVPRDLVGSQLENPEFSVSHGFGVYVFKAKKAIVLDANSSYVVVVRNNAESPFLWKSRENEPAVPTSEGERAKYLTSCWGPPEDPAKWRTLSNHPSFLSLDGAPQ